MYTRKEIDNDGQDVPTLLLRSRAFEVFGYWKALEVPAVDIQTNDRQMMKLVFPGHPCIAALLEALSRHIPMIHYRSPPTIIKKSGYSADIKVYGKRHKKEVMMIADTYRVPGVSLLVWLN